MKILRYAILALLSASALAAEPARVVVDTAAQSLTVFRGSDTLAVFEDIAIGRGGVTVLKKHGDNKTPLGTFEIVRTNYDSRFEVFFGFDYPTPAHAARALEAGLIGRDVYRNIVSADRNGHSPPQNTALGGYLGIHGIGAGDIRIHRRFNWTEGCIALTNKQIKHLDKWIGIGTTVVVR